MRKWGYWGNVKMSKCDGKPFSHSLIFALSHFLILIFPYSHITLCYVAYYRLKLAVFVSDTPRQNANSAPRLQTRCGIAGFI